MNRKLKTGLFIVTVIATIGTLCATVGKHRHQKYMMGCHAPNEFRHCGDREKTNADTTNLPMSHQSHF